MIIYHFCAITQNIDSTLLYSDGTIARDTPIDNNNFMQVKEEIAKNMGKEVNCITLTSLTVISNPEETK